MELVASAFLDPLCERLIDAALEEYRLVRDADEEIKNLGFTVKIIRDLLQDAEKKQVTEEGVLTWLKSLKQVLYDAEDIIDEVATDAALQAGEVGDTRSVIHKRTMLRNVLCCFGSIDRLQNRHDIAHQIKNVRKKLDDLCHEKDRLGLQALVGKFRRVHSIPKRPDTSSLLADQSYIVGREGEKKEVVQLLLELGECTDQTNIVSNVHVLGISGMGGVGKTTLAKLVFNDHRVEQHFQPRMWVCVTKNFDLRRITGEIIDAIFTSDEKAKLPTESSNWDSTQKKLKDKIKDRRFLLVLDDVWEEDPSQWESLFEPLKYGGKGSKILVTTRNQKVSKMIKGTTITLKSLSDEDLWPILRRYAFDGNDSHVHIQFENMGRQIVEKLKGSPLAAKTIGRVLNERLDIGHWRNILRSEISKLQHHANDISPMLKLSYDHLSGHLKECFAYCSLFPKHYPFSKHVLVPLWMAQNIVQVPKGSQAEIVQGEYFDELLYKSFFEQSKYTGQYVMHDLIHDLAESASIDDCFRLGDDGPVEVSETVRHVSFATNNFDLSKLKELCEHGRLRTLLFLRGCRFELSPCLDELFVKLKRLRVLGLEGCKVTQLPTSVGRLKHLRFVDLSRTLISNLPESFCSLYNLQVLKLEGCKLLIALPYNMRALINLRHLEAEEELVSDLQGLQKLTALQKQEINGSKVRELGDMHMLRELRIRGLEQVRSREEATQARLDTKEHLEVLELDSIGNFTVLDEEIVDGLKPADSIKQLVIKGYGGLRSPKWMVDPSLVSSFFLERLALCDCRNWKVLPPLGQLCCLKFLKVTSMRKVRRIGPEFFGYCGAGTKNIVQGFPSLEELEFVDMPNWEVWEVSCGDSAAADADGRDQSPFLPRLRTLKLSGCPELVELPALPSTLEQLLIDSMGLTCLPGLLGCPNGVGTVGNSNGKTPSLTSLSIDDCPNLISLADGLVQQPLCKLKCLAISSCEDLQFLPEGGFGHLTSLESLKMVNCPELSWVPSISGKDLGLPCSLEEVETHGCGNTMDEMVLASLHKLVSLTKLEIRTATPNITALLVRSMTQYSHLTTTLRILDISQMEPYYQCTMTTTVTSNGNPFDTPMPPFLFPVGKVGAGRFEDFTTLTRLKIQGCSNLLQERGLPSSLQELTILEDENLDEQILSACLRGLSSLKSLTISYCPLLRALPAANILCRLTALRTLVVENCWELTSLGDLHAVISLEALVIENCPSLLSLVKYRASSSSSPSPLSPPAAARVMQLKAIKIMESSPQNITTWLLQCPSLQKVEIESCPMLVGFDDDVDDDGRVDGVGRKLEIALLKLAPCLRLLYFGFCENLRSLPPNLRRLSSLEDLSLYKCPEIRCLPAAGLPKSLEFLEIDGSPFLNLRCTCEVEGGDDRHLISHVPQVRISE